MSSCKLSKTVLRQYVNLQLIVLPLNVAIMRTLDAKTEFVKYVIKRSFAMKPRCPVHPKQFIVIVISF